jgi:hypothetical protein
MSSKMLDGFTGVDLVLPHTGETIRCAVPPLKKAAELIRLFERSKASDAVVADLIDEFPKAVEIPQETFDGLTPAEFMGLVTGFFSARRDLELLRRSTDVRSPSSASSSTGPT